MSIEESLKKALETKTPVNVRFLGCCRVYITLSKYVRAIDYFSLTKKEIKAKEKEKQTKIDEIATVCNALGIPFQKLAHEDLQNAIYIGYANNANAVEFSKAESLKNAINNFCDIATIEYIGD